MNPITYPLKARQRGTQVAILQAALAEMLNRGVLPADAELAAAFEEEMAKQTFGAATTKLVGLFQRERSLEVSGSVDEATAGAITGLIEEWTKTEGGRTIEGAVVYEDGRPAAKLALRLYRRDFGGKATKLKDVTTGVDGGYAFQYDSGGKAASFEVRAIGPDGKEVPLSRPLNLLETDGPARVDLAAPAGLAPVDAEYRRLAADLTPQVGDLKQLAKAKETTQRQDLTVLNRATGWDARLIALAASAERLVQDPSLKLSAEAVYGLLRTGLPSDRIFLAHVDQDVVVRALSKAQRAGIVRMTDAEVKTTGAAFAEFAAATRLETPVPGARSTYADLLADSGLPAAQRDAFGAVFARHRGTGPELWEAARKAGLDDPAIKKLQLQGKCAYLAGSSAPITNRLLNAGVSDPVELVEKDFHRADTWTAEILAEAGVPENRRAALAADDRKKIDALVPDAYAGDTAEARMAAYADDMARKVRVSYPTQVVNRLMATDPKFRLTADHQPTVTLLDNAVKQGFRLGRTPVGPFMRDHGGVRGGLNDAEFDAAQQQLRSVQRTYQITPSDESMAVMLSLGITSAYDAIAYEEPRFVQIFNRKFYDMYGRPPKLGLAIQVRRRAEQVSNVTYNLFTIAKKLDAEPPIAGMSAPVDVVDGVKNELIKHYPTMESLFGSMDYCECDHCRSVLSPAAYLVDLLQFVDADAGVWGNFLAQWQATHGGAEYLAEWNTRPDGSARPAAARKPYDALIERRPDLAHIPLTCENTHTAMPYIDVVNEILEYLVAHGRLGRAAARDTGLATTEELLAEPQYVIREAYDALRGARYPLGLPFDLWIETVRRFADYFETPLHRVLETFRRSDELFVPAEPFDRAAVFAEQLGLAPVARQIFTDPDPLANDKWHALYGFPAVRPAIRNPTNVGDATLRVPNADAVRLRVGLEYTYFDVSANGLAAEAKTLASVGAANSGGAGQALIRFSGTWGAPPEAGDLLVCDAPRMLRGGKKLARRLEVTYKELAQILTTGFVNPELGRLVILYKLGVGVGDARFYAQNRALIAQNPANLSTADQKKRLEAVAFADALAVLAAKSGRQIADLEAAVLAIPFDKVLVLADPDTGCSFDLTSVQFANGAPAGPIVFLRINLFVRLRWALGWSIEEVDRALQAFVPNNTPFEVAHLATRPLETAIIYLAHLKTLDMTLKVGKQSRLKLLTLWTDLPTMGENPLYAQLFLTRSVLESAPVFDDPLGRYLANPAVKLAPYSVALQGGLGLTADDIERILVDEGSSTDTADLLLPTVSRLYRHGVLAKALKLSVADLLALKRISGLDPCRLLAATPLQLIADDHPFTQTLEFVRLAGLVKELGLKVEDLDYLLRHRFDETGKYRPDPASNLALLKTLTEGIRNIRAEHAIPVDPAELSDEVLQQKLGLVLPPDVVATFLAMLSGTAEFTATRTGVALAGQLPADGFAGETAIREIPYSQARQEQKLTFRGVLFDAEKAAMLARLPDPGPGNPHVPSPLLGQLLDDAQQQARAFFDLHLLRAAPGTIPAPGFLDAADYQLLFAPPAAGLTEDQLRDLDRQQRDRLGQAFLPFLQNRLISQLVIDTMIARTGGDPALVEGLVTDQRLVANPTALIDAFAATGARGVTATFFASNDATGAPLATVTAADADTGATDANGVALKPGGTNSARIEGYFEVPIAGAYRFVIELDKQNAEAELEFPHLAEPVFLSGAAAADGGTLGTQADEYLELTPSVLYRFALTARKLAGGNVRLAVQGETLPKGSVSQLTLYPAGAMDQAEQALLLLSKSLLLLGQLGLSEREARYLLVDGKADFGNPSLSGLPTATVGDTALERTATVQRFAWHRRLAGYAQLKRNMAGGTEDLIAIFEANGTQAANRLETLVYPAIATLTRREAATVKAAAEALWPAPAFASERPLERLWDALQVVERFGVAPGDLVRWMRIVAAGVPQPQRFEIARDVRDTIKARFEAEAWQRVAQPIFDKLRQKQRDALVAHAMERHGFQRMEQLYEYLLIDPGMEPVVQTSRIRLAIGSLQLFIQRCLLNLEPRVHPSTINAGHWEWMKRFRVWEANRKIFLFPENWLEPEFRDDKTHLFTELEGALFEGDVSSDLVEDAFLNYLRKLDELARLDIAAMHLEDSVDPAGRVLHVIGRTFGQPHKYFYRRFAHQMWTPWEPITAEIEGDHLAPVIWRDRLYLFWVTFVEKADDDATISSSGSSSMGGASMSTALTALNTLNAKKKVEAQLHWAEYVEGEWGVRETGGYEPLIEATVPANYNLRRVLVHVSKEYDPEDGAELGVYIHLHGSVDRAFYLAGRNAAPEATTPGAHPGNPFASANVVFPTRYRGRHALTVSYDQRITTEPGKPPKPTPVTPNVLSQSEPSGAHYLVVPCNNDLLALGASEDAYRAASNPGLVKAAVESGLSDIATLIRPVFYQDSRHTFFVEPDLTERTVEEWEEWTVRIPETEPGWRIPEWWDDLVVIPERPRKLPFPDDGPLIYPESLVNPVRDFDWLINPATVVRFEETLVGPLGQPGLEIVEVLAGKEGTLPVSINSASGIAGGSKVIVADAATFGKSGLDVTAGAMNVVGGGGFNTGLEQQFNQQHRNGFGDAPRSGGVGR